MRNRISRALLTATAAGAAITTLGFMAGNAGASTHVYFTPSAPQTGTDARCFFDTSTDVTGTWNPTDCGKTGYVATGRDFRYAQALVTIPDHTGDVDVDPTLYVALDDSHANTDYARVGVEPCEPVNTGNCSLSGWEAFYDVSDNGSILGGTATIPPATEGDGVFLSVYLSANDNAVHEIVTPPSGTVINNSTLVSSPTYTDAQAFADWTEAAANDDGEAPVHPPAISNKVRTSQFEEGQFTTWSGATGTFKGPWTLTAVDATSNGDLPPTGSLIAQPSYLWTSSASYHGEFGDSFGVWRYPF